jgi:hypothetical protein
MTRASFNWALTYGFSETEPSSRLDGQKCIFFDAAQLGILRNYCVLSAGRLDFRAESRRLGEVTAKKYEYSPSLLHVKTGTKVQLKITPTAMIMVSKLRIWLFVARWPRPQAWQRRNGGAAWDLPLK